MFGITVSDQRVLQRVRCKSICYNVATMRGPEGAYDKGSCLATNAT